MWENGAGASPAGAPVGTAESNFAAWPVPGTVATALVPAARRQARGHDAHGGRQPRPGAASSYLYDPSSKRSGTFDGSTGAIWTAATQTGPDIHWNPLTEGDSSSYLTDPFSTETARPARAASTCGCGPARPTPTSR